jgi:SOS-response transcriptional repressor LexA
LSHQAGDILARFGRLMGETADSAAAEAALRALIAQVEQALPAAKKSPWKPAIVAKSQTQVPIVGRTAAGILAPWERFFAGHSDEESLERLIRKVEGRPGLSRSGEVRTADPQRESQPQPAAPVMLIQLSEPTSDGIVEFIDLAGFGAVAPGTFALRVDGSSMAPRILDGDIVVSRRDAVPEPGQTAIVKVRGHVGVTVKLWRPEGDTVHLIPINESCELARFPRTDILWACRVLWVVRF